MSKSSNATESPLVLVSTIIYTLGVCFIHPFPILQQDLLAVSRRSVLDLGDCDRDHGNQPKPIVAEATTKTDVEASW